MTHFCDTVVVCMCISDLDMWLHMHAQFQDWYYLRPASPALHGNKQLHMLELDANKYEWQGIVD